MTIDAIINWILKFIAVIIAALAPIATVINLVLLLIVIDLFTGTYASIKNKEPFSARKLRYTVEKFVFYSVAIIAGYILQIIFFDAINVAQMVAGYISLTESKSIYENISKILKTDILKEVWKLIKLKFDKKITNETE